MPAKQGCDNAEIDLVFVLDASGSVGEPNFVLVKNFVKDFLFIADIDNGNVRVGVVIYSTKAYVQFHLKDYNSKPAILQAMDNIPFSSGSTNTADALNTMRTQMFTRANGERPNVTNIAIVVTDGISSRNPIPEAEQARAADIHIYAIGIGLRDTTELDGIASKPAAENSFAVQKFSELRAMRDQVISAFCSWTSTVQTSTTDQSKTQSTRTLVPDTTNDVLPTSEKTSEKASPTELSNPTTQYPMQSTQDAITDISQMLPNAIETSSPIPIPTTKEAATTQKAMDTSDAIESTHVVTTAISDILQTLPSTIPNGRKDNSSAAPSTTNPSNTETRSTGPSFSTSTIPKYTSIPQRPVKSRKRLCTCAFVRNMTSPQSPISDVIDAIKKELRIEVSKLSLRRRRKESSIDARPSTNQIGYVSVIFLVALFGGILLSDLPKIYRDITVHQKTRRNKQY
ncbi:matrilin-2-like [Littorina saxatilis]|uniref:matrilin-2-like n=1 Tax=Littorina saxatilis TaxID=31220 RepID=UPI0038B47362